MMIHKGLTPKRWFKFSIFEQLANVGCDVARAIHWKKVGNLDYSQKAFDRVLELLDLTIADPKNRGGRLRELLRVREALVDFIMYDNEYGTSEEFWHQYFYDFNYAAALQKGK
jgi:hypothetical protein